MKSLQTSIAAALLCIASQAWAADPAPVAAPAPAAPATTVDETPLISSEQLSSRLAKQDSGLLVLDVRSAEEYSAGHVPGARNISHDQLPGRLDELAAAKDQEVVLYCRSGRRAALAADTLRKAGFTRLLHLDGDFQAWEKAQRPVER